MPGAKGYAYSGTQWLCATGVALFALAFAGIWWPQHLIENDTLSLRAILVTYAFGGLWVLLYAGWRRHRHKSGAEQMRDSSTTGLEQKRE